jgi:hypothetical protein
MRLILQIAAGVLLAVGILVGFAAHIHANEEALAEKCEPAVEQVQHTFVLNPSETTEANLARLQIDENRAKETCVVHPCKLDSWGRV